MPKIGIIFPTLDLFTPLVSDRARNLRTAWLKKPLPAALTLVLLWSAYRLIFLSFTGIPQPAAHDEFSYLLEADTFAHGRLANPPHPLAKFFESPHILVRPTYASKYPPGQPLFLALGQRLFGSAFYGVIIGNAFMLFTFCLMLFVWVPYQSAWAASGMVALALSPSMYWTNSYWGGSVAASGAALVLLGIGIHRTKQTPFAGGLFAIGVLLLFWTRPFEGGVFTLLVLILFAKGIWRGRSIGVFLAAASVFAVGAAWTSSYNRAVTGNPFLLPYILHDRQYNVTPVFWLMPMRPDRPFSHPRLASQHGADGWEARFYDPKQPRWRFLKNGLTGALRSSAKPLRVALILTLLAPFAWRDPRYRKMAVIAAAVLVALTIETYHLPHYAAPLWAAFALMVAVWAEYAWNLPSRKALGVALVIIALASPLVVQKSYPSQWLHLNANSAGDDHTIRGFEQRAALIKQLSALEQLQLVIVRYPSPDWKVTEEWVYNGADIDQQTVVFAHDLGAEQDQQLLAYYPNRKAWLLTFDSVTGQDRIQPYSSAFERPSLRSMDSKLAPDP